MHEDQRSTVDHQFSTLFQIASRASKQLRDMLMRGFTTVRDAGGADWGLAQAVEEGTIIGKAV